MTKKLNSALIAGALLLSLSPAGCSKKEESAPAPAPAAKPAPKPVTQPAAPVQKQLSSALQAKTQLDFRSRRDPFKPFTPVVAAPAKTEGEPKAPLRPAGDLLPIQSYEVTKFKVAGIIAGLKENRALLIDPAGKGYVVQEGMLIGSNDGRITRISASSVEVEERFREEKGRVKKRKIVLTLAKKR